MPRAVFYVVECCPSQIIQLQENLFNIKMYHTPSGLRALTRVFILVTPWAFGGPDPPPPSPCPFIFETAVLCQYSYSLTLGRTTFSWPTAPTLLLPSSHHASRRSPCRASSTSGRAHPPASSPIFSFVFPGMSWRILSKAATMNRCPPAASLCGERSVPSRIN